MNQRQQSLIYQLSENNNYITTKKLAEHFHVSERTIHSDLNTIETWLRDKHLPLMFERKRYRYLVEWSASRKGTTETSA